MRFQVPLHPPGLLTVNNTRREDYSVNTANDTSPARQKDHLQDLGGVRADPIARRQRSTLPARTPTKVSAMAMARAIAEAMKAATMCSLRTAATMAGPTI